MKSLFFTAIYNEIGGVGGTHHVALAVELVQVLPEPESAGSRTALGAGKAHCLRH